MLANEVGNAGDGKSSYTVDVLRMLGEVFTQNSAMPEHNVHSVMLILVQALLLEEHHHFSYTLIAASGRRCLSSSRYKRPCLSTSVTPLESKFSNDWVVASRFGADTYAPHHHSFCQHVVILFAVRVFVNIIVRVYSTSNGSRKMAVALSESFRRHLLVS